MDNLINQIIKQQKPCYFISPHLDDAAFSAGGLIAYLAGKTKVVALTTFTRAGKDKHSLSGLAYAKKCGFVGTDMSKFFGLRRKEDRELWQSLGVEAVHLPFADALWRPKSHLNLIERMATLVINDFRYIYPTHRLHVAKGKIVKQDLANLRKLENKLKKVVRKDGVVFCPLGLGKHVDHIMARTACKNVFPEVVYWEDAPYNLYHQIDKEMKDFIAENRLQKMVFDQNQEKRKAMYPAYKTQFGKLFGGEIDFSLLPESYYLRDTQMDDGLLRRGGKANVSYYLDKIKNAVKVILSLKLFREVSNWWMLLLDYLGLISGDGVIRLSNGAQFQVLWGSSDKWSIHEIVLCDQYCLKEIDYQEGVIVDIGANIGVFSVYQAMENKDVKIYAFEPEPINFKRLSNNIKLNRLSPRIKAFQQAMAEKREFRRLYLSSDHRHHTFMGEKSNDFVLVKARLLEDFLSTEKINNCDLLKLDVEGAEYEIIYSLPVRDLQKIRYISLEYHNLSNQGGRMGTALRGYLQRRGFAVTQTESLLRDVGTMLAINTKGKK